MGYKTVFIEPFNYANGQLYNYDNWYTYNVPHSFYVTDNVCHNAYNISYTSLSASNQGIINFPDSEPYVHFVGKIGFLRGLENRSVYSALSSQTNWQGWEGSLLCGIGFKEGAAPDRHVELIGWKNGIWHVADSNLSITCDGTLYDFDILYYRGELLNPAKYIHFIFNGTDYIDNMQGSGATGSPKSLILRAINNADTTITGFWDGIGCEYPKKKKYAKFPRWQKTKYGLRPCY